MAKKEMQEVLIITVKGNHQYTFHELGKSVKEVLKEINDCKEKFYEVFEDCAIVVSEIVSVEKYLVEVQENEKVDN